ncbi:MAG: GHKL domain-containing protein [Calditrichaeota bacterium]|nr:GHKL domain-containing protein [Calditrichota bacterium]
MVRAFVFSMVIFVLGFWGVPPGRAIHLNDLRYFPELDTVSIHRVIYRNPSTIFLQSDKDFYRWTGAGWKRVNVPLKEAVEVREIFPYDASRFVITYSPTEYYYHSGILFYDGNRWRSIAAKQPYKITTVDFVDSLRFYAVGIWGSFIYFNGDSTRILPSLPAMNYSRLWVISPNTLYVIGSSEQVDLNETYVLKYAHGNWEKIAKIPRRAYTGYIWHPDSGLIVSNKGMVYRFQNDTLRLLFQIKTDYIKLPFILNRDEKRFYFWEGGAFWKIGYDGQPLKLFDFPKFAKIMPVSSGYLILYNNQMFYYGSSDLGRPLSDVKPFFESFPMGNNRTLGMSFYINDEGKTLIYLSIPDRINQFHTVNIRQVGGIQIYQVDDIIFKTGLLEYERQRGIFDGGLGFADLDNDGDRDAVLFSLNGQTQFFENVGSDQFRNITREVGLSITTRITQIEFVDFDQDGLLDMVLGNELGHNYFIRNRGFLRFEDVSESMALSRQFRSYLPAFADLDGDADADVVLYSIYGPIRYFENVGLDSNRLPIFEERSQRSPQLTRNPFFFTQSVSFADFDNDGDLDILLANRNRRLKLFENEGNFRFRDVSREKGVHYRFMAYGGDWGDLDADGDLDLVLGTLGKNYIFWNLNGERFQIDSTTFINNELSYTTATAVIDLDRDGDLDVAMANYLIGSDRMYINTMEDPAYLIIQVQGGAQNNRDGLGCTVRLFERDTVGDGQRFAGMRYLRSHTGYNAYKYPQAYFGVRKDRLYNVEVLFPNGRIVRAFNLRPGRTYQILEVTGVNQLWHTLITAGKEWIFRENKRIHIYRFLAFMVVFLLFNVLIRYLSFWPVMHVLFFNTILFSTYLLLDILLFTLDPQMNWLVPFYFVLLAGGIAYYVIEKYTSYKFGSEFKFELFDLFRQFHHSRNGLVQINHLIFFCSNIKDGDNPDVLREFLKEVNYFRMFTVPFIHSVLKMAVKLKTTRESARQAIRLLKTIEHQLQQLYFIKDISPKRLVKLKAQLLHLKSELLVIRKQTELAVSCDVTQVIAQTLRRYHELTEVTFLRSPGVTLPLVVIPEDVLSRVLGDLFQNALEAMKEQPQKKLDVHVQAAGDGVEILITDYGQGIKPHIQSRIFEDHFSTKKSTGLGLFHARKLLEKFGGNIQLLKSAPGKGTTFRIYLKGVTHG